MSIKQAISYIRVSGKGQLDGDGFDRQREAVRRFARAAGYEVVEEFREDGVSGTTDLEDRPALIAAFARLANNGIATVIVERADRLARDLLVQESIIKQFVDIGARVLTADGFDLTNDSDPTRTLIRQVLGAVFQFEKRLLVLKLRAARKRKKASGARVEGVKPYGMLDGEEAVVERMRALRRKRPKGRRMSYAGVAQALNAEGFRTRGRRGRAPSLWTPQLVHSVLEKENTTRG